MSLPLNRENIDHIKQATLCTDETAKEALAQSDNINEAIELAYTLHQSSLNGPKPRIIKRYNNGILVEGKFFDFSKKENREIERNFSEGLVDINIFGGKVNDKIEVRLQKINRDFIVVKENEFKKEEPKLKFVKNMDCPDKLVLDEDGDIFFGVYTGNARVTVTVKRGKTMNVVINEFKKYTKDDFVIIKSDGIVMEESELVENINRTIVIINYK